MKRDKDIGDLFRFLVEAGIDVPNSSSASVEELDAILTQVDRQIDLQVPKPIRDRLLRLIKKKRKTEQSNKIEEAKLPADSGGLPVSPIVAGTFSPIGDVNLLMNQVSLTVPPFDKIITAVALELVEKTGGLMPTLMVESMKKNEEEIDRLVARWRFNGPISQAALNAIWEVTKSAHERDISGPTPAGGWKASKYIDGHGDTVTGKFGIYFGPNNYFWSSATGVMVYRKFSSVAEANFLVSTNRRAWISSSSSASGQKPIVTEVEVREGADDKDGDRPGIPQENLLELLIQISSVLARQRVIERRVLMTGVFRALNRVGTRQIDRDKLFGMKRILSIIERVLLFPLQRPDLAEKLCFKSESVLLVGVPGVGKTLLAHYLMAGDYNAIFAPVDSDRLRVDLESGNKKGITPMLLKIDKVRIATQLPVVPIIDDLDAVLAENTVSKFLNLMQGIREKGLHLLTSTNYPEKIDERLLEPGRITQVIYVPRPDRDERYGVLGVHTDKLPFASDAERKLIIEQMANQTAGWTQRYLWDLVVEASRLCGLGVVGGDITRTFRQDNASPVLKAAHFVEARVSVSKRINLVRLRKWDEDIQNFVSRATKSAGFIQK